MNVVRWVFTDVATGETATAMINPNKMSSPRAPKSLTHGFGYPGQSMTTIEQAAGPGAWTFEGITRSEAQYDQIKHWGRKKGKVRVTDHLGRTFEVMMQSAGLTDRQATKLNNWRGQYTISTLLLRRIS